MGTKAKVEQYVGKQGWYSVGAMKIKVEIMDYKNSYGKDRWLVKPVAGRGEVWTEQNPMTVGMESSVRAMNQLSKTL